MKFWVFISFLCIALIFGCEASEEECSENESSCSENEKDGYIFTCPRSISTGATNELQLIRYGNLDAGELNVKVFYQENYNGNESVAFDKTYEIEKGVKTTNLKLFIPNFKQYTYNGRIAIQGAFGEYTIEGSDKVYFNPSKDSLCIIQTNKPIYKNRETVKFRVLNVDKKLKPPVEAKTNITVEDALGTRLFQWNNVIFETGLIQQEFLLANEPVLGNWKISATCKEDDVTTETFDVAEYRLPQYEVTVKTPTFVLVNAAEIPITVCAKYTYGKGVKGDVKMNISLETYQWSDEKLPTRQHEGKIDGCFDYTINVSLIEKENVYRYRRIQIVVSVTEFGTGVQRNTTEYIQRQFTPLSLNFNDDQRQFFKPGLPYNGKLSVTNPDNSPAKDEPIEICYTCSRERTILSWSATKKVKFCKNFTSDEHGMIEYILPPQNVDAVGITIEAKSLKYVKDPKASNDQNSLNQPQTSMSLTPFYSPSGSFIQVQPVQETLPCGEDRKLKLLFTSKTDADFTFYYEVVNQGKVLNDGSLELSFSADTDDVSSQFNDDDKVVDDTETVLVPEKYASSPDDEKDCPAAKEIRYVPPIGEAEIQIPIRYVMSSNIYVLVYYIRKDRETVADSQKIKVEKCFKNEVEMHFGDSEAQPGTRTGLKITASPNSLCGIKVVDKSVSLLNNKEQITKEKIFSLLDSLDTGMYYGVNHCNEEIPQPGLYKASSPSIILPPKPWSTSSYEDSMASFENVGYLVISDLKMFNRPCKGRSNSGNFVAYDTTAVRGGGAVALASTARRPAPAPTAANEGAIPAKKAGVTATKSVSEVRSEFPETWLFDLEMIGDDGEFVTKKTLPDTITEWVGDAFCINYEDGLGVANKTSINAFQAFFISTVLPYSVIRGEQFFVYISIFNYVKEALPITISFEEPEGFKVVGDPIDGDICIQPDTSTVLKLKLEGTKLGSQNITIKAQSAESDAVCADAPVSNAVAKDAVRQSIIVEPEGWPREKVENSLFCPSEEENGVFEKTYSFELPEDVVEDSSRAIVDFTGNPLGKAMDNLGNLISLPTGCGEQNMVKFVPNIVVLDLLTETGDLKDKDKENIIRNLNVGYQNEMKYRRSDGSFSAFGATDRDGSLFLTAFVLRSFIQALNYISIEKSVITDMQNWIVSKQQADGCFPNVGNIIHKGLQGGIDQENANARLTAYTYTSLLISKYDNQTVMDLALSCMKEHEDSSAYTQFLYAYAEVLSGENESAKERIAEARKKSITKDGTEYFIVINGTLSQRIETNGYALLSSMKSGSSPSSVLPLVRYLTNNTNPNGGFYSTQDTVVGLQGLGEFAKAIYNDELDIQVKTKGALEDNIELTQEYKLLVERRTIKEVPSEMEVEATGPGCALIQTFLRYNSKISPEERYFDLAVRGDCVDNSCKKVSITVSVSYLPDKKETGMALIEIKMITGMVPDRDSLAELMDDNENLKLMKFEVEKNSVNFYFDELTNDIKVFRLIVTEVVAVENYQPAQVTVYDYYDRDIASSTTYTIGDCEKGSCSHSSEP